jgi:flavodoxin
MKCAVVYISVHHQNTEKIAAAISKELGADLFRISDVDSGLLEKYDMIGFGSGIYFGKHHKKLFEHVMGLDLKDKDVFVFSTSGSDSVKYNKKLIDVLDSKGADVKGSFSCKGYDTYGVLKWIGGIAKGRPNEGDIEDARDFADTLKKLEVEENRDVQR